MRGHFVCGRDSDEQPFCLRTEVVKIQIDKVITRLLLRFLKDPVVGVTCKQYNQENNIKELKKRYIITMTIELGMYFDYISHHFFLIFFWYLVAHLNMTTCNFY